MFAIKLFFCSVEDGTVLFWNHDRPKVIVYLGQKDYGDVIDLSESQAVY